MRWQFVKKDKVHLIEIENDLGLKVQINKVGASIYAIYYNDEIMTLTPANMKDFNRNDLYYGKTVGPIPNRLENGEIEIEGKIYKLDKNEGNNTLHSGRTGLSNCIFNALPVVQTKDAISLLLRYMPALGNRNLPGKTAFTVTYTISNVDNSIYVTLNGLADKKTIISMTNHAYFNLGEPNLEKISLKLPSKSFIETRETDLIPLREREILPCLDFNRPKRILNDIDDPYLKNHRSFGIDHCFKLDSKNLSLESLKYKLEIETDFKYVQIYTDNYEDGVKMIGTEDKHYRGVAIEPQDSILNRELTEKNTPYQRYILYKFSKK